MPPCEPEIYEPAVGTLADLPCRCSPEGLAVQVRTAKGWSCLWCETKKLDAEESRESPDPLWRLARAACSVAFDVAVIVLAAGLLLALFCLVIWLKRPL